MEGIDDRFEQKTHHFHYSGIKKPGIKIETGLSLFVRTLLF
ncbi:hypothetical protein CLV81_2888 [Flagellimonas meridianipacifica]|uniref:Uncharacterized protein n=1 Tax=Flagellimonas meridianipacifica TaxID=1080225 RepID=A0A2T0MAE5_9FLAO|nr:hypothetical protein CLV81_2888 [Allomuricauda pacifica]